MNRSRARHGFTLIELLVVISIIGVLAAVLIGGLGGGSDSVKLQSGQTMIANLLTVARSKAISSGRRTRLAFHADVRAGHNPERFLNYIILQQLPTADSEWNGNDWLTLSTHKLPEGIYTLPYDLSRYPGILPEGVSASTWQYSSTKTELMASRLFRTAIEIGVEIDMKDGQSASYYQGIMFTHRGTISKLDGFFGGSSQNDIIVVTGQKKSPSGLASGSSPIAITNPDLVRSVLVSTYGVLVLINNREDIQ